MASEQRLQKFHTNDVYYPDLGSAPDWLKPISLATRPIRSTTQIRVVTRNQYGISANVAQTSFGGNQWWRHEVSAVSQAISTQLTWISFPFVQIWRTYYLNCLWGKRFAFLPQLSVSFNVKDGGRALFPRMISSVARQNTPQWKQGTTDSQDSLGFVEMRLFLHGTPMN